MDKYEILEQVGKGSFGAVTKIRRKSDQKLLVWKEISYGRMKEKEKQQLVSEVNILREFRHPHIVKYYDRIVDKTNSKIFIVMEFCEKGDLGHLIKKHKRDGTYLNEENIWRLFSHVLLALQACHNRPSGKILHRDIKPGNILMDSNSNAKLADFGLSRIMGENSVYAETKVGTPYYMSPEQIADMKYNEKSDIWSAGCLLFEMASLHPPFQAKSHAELASKINKGQIEPLPARYSDDLRRLVSWMMALDPSQRPTVNEILNLPYLGLRPKDKQPQDEASRLKDLEKHLIEREEKLKTAELELKKREEVLARREKRVKEQEEKYMKLEAIEKDQFTKPADQDRFLQNRVEKKPPIFITDKENIIEKPKDSPIIPRRVLKAEKVFENLQNDFYPKREDIVPEKARTPNLIPKSPNVLVKDSPVVEQLKKNPGEVAKARVSPNIVRKETNDRTNPFRRQAEAGFNRFSPEAYDRWICAKDRIVPRPQNREGRRPQTANVDDRKAQEGYAYSPEIGYYQRKEVVGRRCASAEKRYPGAKFSPEMAFADRKGYQIRYNQEVGARRY